MAEARDLESEISKLFLDKMNLEVPSRDTDLMETGLLDSLALVDLLSHLEREYRVKISVENMELENFRTIVSIAAFVAKENGVWTA